MKTLLAIAAVVTALGTGSGFVQAQIERHDFNVQSEPGIASLSWMHQEMTFRRV